MLIMAKTVTPRKVAKFKEHFSVTGSAAAIDLMYRIAERGWLRDDKAVPQRLYQPLEAYINNVLSGNTILNPRDVRDILDRILRNVEYMGVRIIIDK